MPQNFASKLSRFGDSLKDAAENVLDKIDDKVDLPIVIDFVRIKKAGDDCYSTARETSGLCTITIEKAHQMVSFGRELQATLKNVTGGGERSLDASKFAIIQDLVDGDKIKEATKLARDLSGLSLECVNKSREMMVAMEQGIGALPDAIEPFVENRLNRASTKGHKKGDPKLPENFQRSITDLKGLVEDVENVNFFTVVERGSAAFDGLRKNGELSKDMFASIQNFAEDVETVSGSFREFKVEDFRSIKTLGKIRKAASSAWRCLRLSGLIKVFAEQVRELIEWMISLFEIASKKLGAIWGGLANAKELLSECLEGVIKSIHLCERSKEKSLLLRNTSGEIRDHLGNIAKIGTQGPNKAMKSLLDLADGDKILLCIKLGTKIDDMFAKCIKQVIGTIDRVDRAISDMPEVLKQDVPKLALIDGDNNDGIDFEDYEYQAGETQQSRNINGSVRIRSRAASATMRQAGIRKNVRALENMTTGIESSSALRVIQRSAEGFNGVHEAIGTCQNLIVGSRGYAENCKNSIDSFNNGEWNLALATKHILEIFAIRDAGIALKLMAKSILELVRANLALMKAVQSRPKGMGLSCSGSGGLVGGLVNSLVSDVDIDDLKGLGEGIKKLGSFFR